MQKTARCDNASVLRGSIAMAMKEFTEAWRAEPNQ